MFNLFLFFSLYRDQIMRSIRRHKHAMGALLVDYNDKAEHLSLNDEYFEQIRRY